MLSSSMSMQYLAKEINFVISLENQESNQNMLILKEAEKLRVKGWIIYLLSLGKRETFFISISSILPVLFNEMQIWGNFIEIAFKLFAIFSQFDMYFIKLKAFVFKLGVKMGVIYVLIFLVKWLTVLSFPTQHLPARS